MNNIQKFEFLETNLSKKITTIEQCIVKFIESAKKRIFISAWLLNSEKILVGLLNKAKFLRGHIYIIAALDQNYFHYSHVDDEGETKDYNFVALEKLKGMNDLQCAVEIRGNKNAHAKYIIVDDVRAIITSANFNHASLELSGDLKFHKNEVGLVIRDRKVVEALSAIFKITFAQYHQAHLRFLESPLLQKSLYYLKERDFSYPLKEGSMHRNSIGSMQMNHLIWTFPENIRLPGCKNYAIEQSIIMLTQGESQHLQIASFNWRIKRESPVWNALVQRLQNKDFHLDLILNRPNKNSKDDDLRDLINTYSNFRVFYHPQFHAKFLLTQNNWALFTANLDMEHGLRDAIEVGVVSSETRMLRALKAFFEQMKSESSQVGS